MSTDQNRYDRLIRKKKELEDKKQRNEGAGEQILKRLKEKFGIKSIKDAKALLETEEKNKSRLLEKYEDELSKAEEELR